MNEKLATARERIRVCKERQYTELDLSGLGIADLNDLPEFVECRHLEWLNLGNNQISDIRFLEKLTGLQSLVLSHNQISDIRFLEKLTGLESLDLCGNQISDIRFLEKLTGLQSLVLSHNQISDIRFLEKLTGLESLDLCGNQISDIRFLEKLTGLQSLVLSHNQISDIRFLEKLTGLESLDLGINQISVFRFSGKLTGLQSLNLGGNQISDIRFLEKLTGLQSLELGNNQISIIRFSENLPGLQSLNLYGNQISDGSFLEKLTGLQSLELGYNQISDGSFFEKLTGLKLLELGNNQISDCSFLEKLTGLQSLYLGHNQISDIRFWGKLTRLQSLDLGHNQISDIRFLEKLTGLETLVLDNNQISDYSPLEKLTGLKWLSLARNQISDYSPLEKLTGLKWLSLARNQISDIRFLEKLTGLHSLYLDGNQISDIRFLEKLTGLQWLDLEGNQISDIRFLEKLTELKNLDLRENKITNLPSWTLERNFTVSYLDGIQIYTMNVKGNPLTHPPVEIVKQGKESIRNWFKANRKALNEIKIILIGDPKAGKTSLLRRLKDDTFDKDEVQTDGINIESIKFVDHPTFEKERSLRKLTGHFWDFGGQEIMNATHQFFLTHRSVYILVMDARKDKNVAAQIRQWLKRIAASGGNSPVMIVCNQIDVNPGFGFENEYELQQEFPQIKYFISASCSSEENLPLIKEKLEELIPGTDLFQTEIDEKWISLKEELQKETQADSFINERRFIQLAEKHGVSDRNDQNNAIRFLHDLGILLHFDVEDQSLSEYYVLDPYWITYGVYQILTSKFAGEQKGKIPVKELDYIVNREEAKEAAYQVPGYKRIKYSSNELRFLVDILNQFKLCFYLPDRTHFILPDLLDTAEPLEISLPIRNAEHKIQFVYEYEYLPKSVMPYIMVETHKIMAAMWRTGCIISNPGCKALISSYENKLNIVVTGEHKQKREFLSVIRFLVDAINTKLEIKPDMLIPLPDGNGFVKYMTLLGREKRGKSHYEIDDPEFREFKISELLEGISSQSEVEKMGGKLDTLLENSKRTEGKIDLIHLKLDEHFSYLTKKLGKAGFEGELIASIQSLNENQSQEIVAEVLRKIAEGMRLADQEMDKKLAQIYTDLKQSEMSEVKLKLGLPLISLLGIDLEAKFDVKKWAKKMGEKYGLKIFGVMENISA